MEQNFWGRKRASPGEIISWQRSLNRKIARIVQESRERKYYRRKIADHTEHGNLCIGWFQVSSRLDSSRSDSSRSDSIQKDLETPMRRRFNEEDGESSAERRMVKKTKGTRKKLKTHLLDILAFSNQFHQIKL